MPYKNKKDKLEYDRQYRKNNSNKIKENMKRYREKNSEKIKEQDKLWCKNNPDKVRERGKRYREKNREKLRKRNRLWCKNNPEKMKEKRRKYRESHEYDLEYFKLWRKNNPGYSKQYRENNIERIRIKFNQWQRDRGKIDLKYSINRRISRAIRMSLKTNKAGRKWKKLVGYNINNLTKRLKKTMPAGYNWQNFLDGGLHIDHIIPVSAHNYTKPEHIDFRRCWALSNLQLLPAKENRIKHNKLYKPFQPALKLNLEDIK